VKNKTSSRKSGPCGQNYYQKEEKQEKTDDFMSYGEKIK